MANAEASKNVTRAKGKRQSATFFVMEVKEDDKGNITSFSQLPNPSGVPAGSEGKTAAIKRALLAAVNNGDDTYKGKRLAILFMNSNVFHFGPKPGPSELVLIED